MVVSLSLPHPADHDHDHTHGHSPPHPIIRRRVRKSQRRRDGLIAYAKSVHSQNGEDGILERLFDLLEPSLSPSPTTVRWCVDVGAWDGQHLSNTHELLVSSTGTTSSWRGVLLEADPEKFRQLQARHQPSSSSSPPNNVCLCVTVTASSPDDPQNLCQLLKQIPALPQHFEFLCIDIDGADYWVWYDLLWMYQQEQHKGHQAKVVCIEFNPTMPDDLIYIPPRGSHQRHGASLAALVELGEAYDYVLVETTLYNAFFVLRYLYDQHLRDHVPDTTIEALHETTMGTELYQLYDGTIKLWGCKKLLWHRIALDESKMQMIPESDRRFPFAPNDQETTVTVDDFKWIESAVDVSPMYLESNDDAAAVAMTCQQLFDQLETNGFALVRGTGIDPAVCRAALTATHSFLHDAQESVRRSCLSPTDRARRGYAPMNVENFASLLGEQGPNDLVRKFRIGPLYGDGTGSLVQPNIWPDPSEWEPAATFRAATESYYIAACQAANLILRAICTGLIQKHPELETSLEPLLPPPSSRTVDTDDDIPQQTSSILTLLGYRDGSRHKGKNKGPLVAAHTDVGVITVLLYDGGNQTCASLQRRDGDGWVDVDLPFDVPNDPVFCVNVADCLSDLSGHRLPSTVHRVVANRQSRTPRNCCALFVGLDPASQLRLHGETEAVSYEEWRRQRIARSQQVLSGRSSAMTSLEK